jgi:hypothetical protein
VLALTAVASAGAQSFQTGFFDDSAFGPASPAPGLWLTRAASSGASIIRIGVSWAAVAPTQPADPTNPGDPAYVWGGLDAEVAAVEQAGLSPILSVSSSPAWAEGPGMPSTATPGSWEPSAAAFQSFATAIATRYSGAYPNPAAPGTALPAVKYFQAWNEPNLSVYLAPQWTPAGHGYTATGPRIYRSLLNAFYTGVTSVIPQAFIITAGTAPFGDPPGGQRTPPAEFVRSLLCVSAKLKPLPCADPAHFDALAHHPYAISSPYTPALNTDDVSVPDLWKLEQPLSVAERTGRALPAGHKQVWVTEVGWNSNPPNPQGVPMATFERWVEETLYELWSEQVSVVTWYLIQDQSAAANGMTNQSGMYYIDGTPKPALQAFEFPLVVDRRKRAHPVLWLRTPAAGALVVSERVGGSWRPLFKQTVGLHQIVDRSLRGVRATSFEASVGGVTSLVWPPSG